MKKLLYLNNTQTFDAAFNLALEEYLFFNFPNKSIFTLWQNENAVIVGRNQITENEVNQETALKYGAQIIRRMSGGGAVYHDLGNLNFSCLTNNDDKIEIYNIIGEVLKDYNIEIRLSGRNDILVNNRKFSGNAFYESKNRYLHHGTILVSLNEKIASDILTPDISKLKSKGIQSVKSRIVNLNTLIKEPIQIEDLRNKILEKLGQFYKLEPLVLTDEDYQKITDLSRKKYESLNWNFRKNLKVNYSRSLDFGSGRIFIQLLLKNNRIKDITINGDFFNLNDIEELQQLIKNKDKKELILLLSKLNIQDYILGLDNQTFLSLFEEMNGF